MLHKRLIALFLAVMLPCAFLPVSAAAAEAAPNPDASAAALIGDADGDGSVTISDATYIQRYIAEQLEGAALDAAFLLRADTNGDNRIGIEDATNIQRYCAEFDVCGNVGKCVTDVAPPVPSTIDTPVVSLTLPVKTLTLGAGETFPLTVTAEPALTSGETVQFFSDSEAVTVTDDGIIQAAHPGTAVVTCRYVDSTAFCMVTVCPQATS